MTPAACQRSLPGSLYHVGMNILAVIGVVAALGSGGQMDRSIGGKSVNEYHESVYDARQKVYLHSGGD